MQNAKPFQLFCMAVNEKLTDRVREALLSQAALIEKKMFRGIAIMLNDKLLASTGDDELMVRIDPALNDDVLERPGTRNMIMKGKTLKGWVYVKEEELKSKKALEYWLNLALSFNGKAKASKKNNS